MIAIVDYHAGNLASVKKALDHLGQESAITSDADAVARADKIILPGVGHFAATATLSGTALQPAIRDAIGRGVPLLGICLGMQWMFESSQEAPEFRGLAVFPGECGRFPAAVKSPHVGWNQIQPRNSSRLLRGIPAGSFVYFTHSYRAPLVEDTVAECEYGGTFSAAVEHEHVFGVQFHPEKSGTTGLQLLRNFCEL